jgi:hypothetical protein
VTDDDRQPVPEVTVTLTLPAWEAERLAVLIDPDEGLPDLEAVVYKLADHVQQGIYRPGSWERPWLEQAFGYDWTARLVPDTRPEMLSGDGRVIFERPAGEDGDD